MYQGNFLLPILPIFTYFGVISRVYLFVCMYISYKAHNRCTQETFLKGSDFDVNMFSALRNIPSVTMKSIWEVVFRTVTNCDSHKLRHYRRNLLFVAICDQSRDGANWVQKHWKRVLCTWESTHVHFCPFWCYFTGTHVFMYFRYNTHKRCTTENALKWSDVYANVFSVLESTPSGTIDIDLSSCVLNRHKNCDSHKLRQIRNPCRRNLWFVAICDQGSDGTNWVQWHQKRVLGTRESTQVHFWHEYENLHFCPFWCYFTGIHVLMYISHYVHNRCTKEISLK